MVERIIKSKRDIPSVEILASNKTILAAAGELARPLIIELIKATVLLTKNELGGGGQITFEVFQRRIITAIETVSMSRIGRVINGTGVLVHTNLGRAPLPESLFDRIKKQVTGYGNLEYSVAGGKRGKRGELAEKYLALVSSAEAGTIVNNNAAALFIILNSLANRRKILISRGELVQIGGGFRIPDIIRKSGARLVEVGTTNITTLDDYRDAIKENPALILKVHKSNFAVGGFTDEVDLKSLSHLGQEHDIPVINDLGSGVLIDTVKSIGMKEPSVGSSVRSGAALTCFSGDKLLGGVQAGLIVGHREMIDRIKKNPLYRVLRVDKIVFSSIEELLGYYLDDTWKENIKLWRLAATNESELYKRGQELLKKINAGDKIYLEASQAEMGGGSLPETPLPSAALVFHSQLSPQKIAALFRHQQPPVIGRISAEKFMIDLKAIDPDDYKTLAAAIKAALKQI